MGAASDIVRFGVFESDRHAERAAQGRRAREPPPQPFQVVSVMVERPGELDTDADLVELSMETLGSRRLPSVEG